MTTEQPLFLDFNKDLKMIFVRGKGNKIVTRIPVSEAVRVLRSFAAMVPEADMAVRRAKEMRADLLGLVRRARAIDRPMVFSRLTGFSVESSCEAVRWIMEESIGQDINS